jgi:hypothetical protein
VQASGRDARPDADSARASRELAKLRGSVVWASALSAASWASTQLSRTSNPSTAALTRTAAVAAWGDFMTIVHPWPHEVVQRIQVAVLSSFMIAAGGEAHGDPALE